MIKRKFQHFNLFTYNRSELGDPKTSHNSKHVPNDQVGIKSLSSFSSGTESYNLFYKALVNENKLFFTV